jgi:exosome complex component RRP4
MTFSILPPAPVNQGYISDSSDNGSIDSEGDVDMLDTIKSTKRAKHSHSSIITPGETITDDPQWMR